MDMERCMAVRGGSACGWHALESCGLLKGELGELSDEQRSGTGAGVEPDMGVLRGCARGKEPQEESRTKGGRATLAGSLRCFLGYTSCISFIGCFPFLYF